eukprot:2289514-Lingulodinium_polyedra.AAC.1
MPVEFSIGLDTQIFGQFFSTAATASGGLEAWAVTPNWLRRAGPSRDYSMRDRPLADVKRRGRWVSD